MDWIYVALRYVAEDEMNIVFNAQLLYGLGFFTSRESAERKLDEWLSGRGFSYTKDAEGNFVVSEKVHYSIIPLPKNDD